MVANLPWVLHLACATIYLVLAVFVVARRPRALLNRVCAIAILCFCEWSACLAVCHFPGVTKHTAALFYSLGSFAWGSFASLAVLFIVVILRPALVRSFALWVALVVPPVLVIYEQWTGGIAADYIERPWGYAFVWQDSWGAWLAHIHYGIYMVGGLGVLYWSSLKPIAPAKRRQARIISLSAVAPLVLSSLTDVWLPRAGVFVVPNIAPDFTILWVVGLVYAIVRYRMLELTPAVAADRVVETMSDAVFLIEPDGQIAWSNPAARSLVGYTAAALHERTFASLVVGGTVDLSVGQRDVAITRDDQVAIDVALAITEVRGSVGELVGHVCVATDITPRKRTEADLRRDRDELERRVAERTTELEAVAADHARSEARYRTLIESMHEGLWVLDSSDTTTLVNSRLGEILGYPVADLVGRKPQDLALDTGAAACTATLQRAHGGLSGPADWDLRKSDGHRVAAIVQVSPLLDTTGGYAGCVITVMDVTERNQLQHQLARSDRLASLGLLAAGVGHEINNPLTYVIANLEELATKSAPGPLRDRAKEALAGAQRVRDIVKDLRSFSRGGPDELVLVDVHDAIEDAVKLADHEVSFRARLVKDYGQHIAAVLAHRRGLSQVIVNLLVNAAHAIRGGPVESNEIRIETRQEGDSVRVAVIDTGKGIAPDQLQRIFDPFHSTKQTGVGLGLAICHEIVASFSGKIDVTSELGHGSRFVIELPAAKGTVKRVARVPTELPGDAVADQGRVLVIDDEIEVRRAVSRALGKYFQVVAVESASEAQTLLATDPTFDLVFCDVMMPGTSGMALADWLAAELPEVADRIVFMTGGAFIAEAEDYLASTSHPILEKPFLTADLIALARETVTRLGRRS